MKANDKNWEETLEALSTTHTISIRQICRELKTSRTWVNKYVIPYIDSIYLNSNIRGGQSSKGGANWVLLASIALGEKYLNDSIWCNEEQYRNLIFNNIIKCTKQTKCIPTELLVTDPLLYKKEYYLLSNDIDILKTALPNERTVKNYMKISKAMRERSSLHMEMLSELGEEIMESENINITERGKVPMVDYKMANFPLIKEWVAPHDIKEYGDTEESIYRKFFSSGDIRIEIALTDPVSKDISKKIYYIPDDHPIEARYVEEYTLISEANYQKKYKTLLSDK